MAFLEDPRLGCHTDKRGRTVYGIQVGSPYEDKEVDKNGSRGGSSDSSGTGCLIPAGIAIIGIVGIAASFYSSTLPQLSVQERIAAVPEVSLKELNERPDKWIGKEVTAKGNNLVLKNDWSTVQADRSSLRMKVSRMYLLKDQKTGLDVNVYDEREFALAQEEIDQKSLQKQGLLHTSTHTVSGPFEKYKDFTYIRLKCSLYASDQ